MVSDNVAGFSEKLRIAVWSIISVMSGRVSVLEAAQFGRER
jgi:hypothetical protein